jgi:hypothetical protein
MNDPFSVHFMIVGAQKCGTTTLSDILRTHPSVVCCNTKEPEFFSSRVDWRAELPRYERMFPRREGALYFEASTGYTFYPHRRLDIWDHLHAYNPRLKIIYLVRSPIERLTSGYMHSYERGYTNRGFEEALFREPIHLDITRYATQITPFIRRFGADQVRILFFEDLVRDPTAIAREVAAFLGIDAESFKNADGIHANKSVGGWKRHHKYDRPGLVLRGLRRFTPGVWREITDNSARAFVKKPVLSPPNQRVVLHLLRSEIQELEALTGRDLSHWRTPATHDELLRQAVGWSG